MTMPAAIGPVPYVDWRKVAWRLRQILDPERTGGHIAIYSKTRAGKSYLIVHFLLPLFTMSRVVIIDAKGHDKVWRSVGREVTELPEDLTRGGGGPFGTWWRLVANRAEDPEGAVQLVKAALRRIAQEGHVIVIIDEGLDLEGVRKEVDRLLTQGGSHGVSVVICATSPQYAPPQMHRQWAAMLVGQMPDAESHERVARIAVGKAGSPALERVIAQIRRRTFLYVDQAGDVGEGDNVPEPLMALLQAPAGAEAVQVAEALTPA